jgi:O-antigen/teichoic acid export membrane protein
MRAWNPRPSQRLTERLWWSDRTIRIFNVGSLAAFVGAFYLYKWGGAGTTPLVVVVVARIAISVWLWSGRLDDYGRRQGRLARRPPRRYLYPVVVMGFVVGAILGGFLGWNELACGIIVAGIVGVAMEHWHHRLGTDRSLVGP